MALEMSRSMIEMRHLCVLASYLALFRALYKVGMVVVDGLECDEFVRGEYLERTRDFRHVTR